MENILINAKQELIQKLNEYGYSIDDISCFKIKLDEFEAKQQNIERDELEIKGIDVNELLEYLDFEYNDGYGLQLIDGVVLLRDGNWFERNEYDGSEWWSFRVPLNCKIVLGE